MLTTRWVSIIFLFATSMILSSTNPRATSVSFLSWPMWCAWMKAKWRWVLSHNHDHRFITIRLSSTIEPVGHCLCWDASSNHYKSWLLEYREYTTQYSLSQAVWSPYTVTTVHKFCAASAASLMAPFLTPHLDVLVVVPLVLIANIPRRKRWREKYNGKKFEVCGDERGSGVPKEKMTPLLPSSHSLQQNNKKIGPGQSRKVMFGKMASHRAVNGYWYDSWSKSH